MKWLCDVCFQPGTEELTPGLLGSTACASCGARITLPHAHAVREGAPTRSRDPLLKGYVDASFFIGVCIGAARGSGMTDDEIRGHVEATLAVCKRTDQRVREGASVGAVLDTEIARVLAAGAARPASP